MTLSDAKLELKLYKAKAGVADQRYMDLLEFEARVEAATGKLRQVVIQNSQKQGAGDDDMALLADARKGYLDRLLAAEYEKIHIEEKIAKLKSPNQEIIFFKYIRGFNLKKVSEIMSYEYKWTCKLHGMALKAYSEL